MPNGREAKFFQLIKIYKHKFFLFPFQELFKRPFFIDKIIQPFLVFVITENYGYSFSYSLIATRLNVNFNIQRKTSLLPLNYQLGILLLTIDQDKNLQHNNE